MFSLTIFSLHGQDYKQRIKELHRDALSFISQKDSSALTSLNLAMDLAKEYSDNFRIASTANIKAWYFMQDQNLLEAYKNLSEASSHMAKVPNPELRTACSIYRNFSAVLSKSNLHEEAIQYYDSAQLVAEKYTQENRQEAFENGMVKELDDILYFRAVSYKRIGNLNQASIGLTELLKRAVELENHTLKSRAMTQIGLIKRDIGEYEQSASVFRNLIQSSNISLSQLGQAEHNLSTIFLLTNQLDSAELHLKKAIHLKGQIVRKNTKASNRLSLFISYLDLGEVYYKLESYDEAISIWHQALDLDLTLDNRTDLFIIHDWLEDAYKLKDIKKSNYHGKLYSSYFESYSQSRNQIAEESQRINFQLEINKYLNTQKHEETLSTQAASYRQILYVVCFITLFVTLSLLWYFKVYRKNRTFRDMVKVANWDAVPESELPGKL